MLIKATTNLSQHSCKENELDQALARAKLAGKLTLRFKAECMQIFMVIEVAEVVEPRDPKLEIHIKFYNPSFF